MLQLRCRADRTNGRASLYVVMMHGCGAWRVAVLVVQCGSGCQCGGVAMAAWLHGHLVIANAFVLPSCGFTLSLLFCNK